MTWWMEQLVIWGIAFLLGGTITGSLAWFAGINRTDKMVAAILRSHGFKGKEEESSGDATGVQEESFTVRMGEGRIVRP